MRRRLSLTPMTSATMSATPVQSDLTPPMPRRALLKTESLTHRYGNHLALDSLSIEIAAGEVFGYVGPNGAGKTTTFRILSGLLAPTGGRASIDGRDITNNPDLVKQLVGYLPDNFGVYPQLRVWEYLDFFAAAYKVPRADRAERIAFCLSVAGCSPLREKLMGSLSRGMKQRVGIAKTLLHDPKVLILDEPAATLDPRARVHMRELLRDLAKLGKAVLISSHILPELADVCDTIGIVSQGKLIVSGPVSEVLKSIHQSRVIEVRVLDDCQRARELLNGRLGFKSCVPAAESPNTIRVSIDATDTQLSDTLTFLTANGVRVLSFREVMPDLEDAFMVMTRETQSTESLP